jgi:surface polysaccharide O-acyltransferase-like enzyme
MPSGLGRRIFITAALAWIGANVLLALAGMVFGLGDSPVTGTRSVSITQALLSSGTIVSPPLFVMLAAGLLVLGASIRKAWVTRLATVLLVIGVSVIALDTGGGLQTQAPQYGPTRWMAVVVLGWLFVALSALTAIAGVFHLSRWKEHGAT